MDKDETADERRTLADLEAAANTFRRNREPHQLTGGSTSRPTTTTRIRTASHDKRRPPGSLS
jgi:hypothetical protein